MTLLITVFLVLVNIFNTITTNIPKAEGLTAIEAWVIVCVLFVFGALVGETTLNILNIKLSFVIYFVQFSEYAGILLRMKVKVSKKEKKPPPPSRAESSDSQVV
jgi:small neutral amino acid transporter SnatA (MarC family)